MVAGKKIILIDDDVEILNEISSFLMTLGAFAYPCSSGKDFLEKLERERPDLAIIDRHIGFEDGFDLIHSIRAHGTFSHLPIIVVTGDATEDGKKDAILIGADDLLSKPLSLKDLELRLISVLRRSSSYVGSDKIVRVEGVELNLTKHSICLKGSSVELTKTEYKIATELILNKGKIVNRSQIASRYLSLKNSSERTIDVHVNSLRKKLGGFGSCIKTVRGRGYLFHLESAKL